MSLTEDPLVALERFRRDGITMEDKHAFLDAMAALFPAESTYTLTSDGASSFAENISQTADAVAQINKVFEEVSGMFTNETFTLSSGNIASLFQFLNYGVEWRKFSTVCLRKLICPGLFLNDSLELGRVPPFVIRCGTR